MNILSFNIEEWFHILDNDSTRSVNDWMRFPSRIHSNMELIFDILDETNTKATFFVLGWIAQKYPDLVREIKKRGFEIGSHTHTHQLVYEQKKSDFYQDVDRSIKTIEDIVGDKVRMFRAPGFSITEKNKWAFEVLYELGIIRDSSVFPAGRSHGGFRSYNPAIPSIIEYNGVKLKEFPINTYNILGKPFIFSGGGYFRLLPYNLIKTLSNKSDYIMSYFHPRDFDFEQPIVPGLSCARRFKSYVGLKSCKPKLQKWINEFDFVDLMTADKMINWEKVPIIKL